MCRHLFTQGFRAQKWMCESQLQATKEKKREIRWWVTKSELSYIVLQSGAAWRCTGCLVKLHRPCHALPLRTQGIFPCSWSHGWAKKTLSRYKQQYTYFVHILILCLCSTSIYIYMIHVIYCIYVFKYYIYLFVAAQESTLNLWRECGRIPQAVQMWHAHATTV